MLLFKKGFNVSNYFVFNCFIFFFKFKKISYAWPTKYTAQYVTLLKKNLRGRFFNKCQILFFLKKAKIVETQVEKLSR